MERARVLEVLVEAILNCAKVQLAYVRQLDGRASLHPIAPIDIRLGDTPKTRGTQYLWAWCYAERKAEMHLIDRITAVAPMPETFDPHYIAQFWPANWPLPEEWTVSRDWQLA